MHALWSVAALSQTWQDSLFASQLTAVQKHCNPEYLKYCSAGDNDTRPMSVFTQPDNLHCLVTSLTLGHGAYFSPHCGDALNIARHTMAELPGNDIALMMKCNSTISPSGKIGTQAYLCTRMCTATSRRAGSLEPHAGLPSDDAPPCCVWAYPSVGCMCCQALGCACCQAPAHRYAQR